MVIERECVVLVLKGFVCEEKDEKRRAGRNLQKFAFCRR